MAGSLILFFFGQKLIDLLMGACLQCSRISINHGKSPLLILKAVNVALSSFLIARQNQEMKLLPLAFVAILKAILIIVFYKKSGLEGMVIIFLICELILLIFYAIQLLRSTKLRAKEPYSLLKVLLHETVV